MIVTSGILMKWLLIKILKSKEIARDWGWGKAESESVAEKVNNQLVVHADK